MRRIITPSDSGNLQWFGLNPRIPNPKYVVAINNLSPFKKHKFFKPAENQISSFFTEINFVKKNTNLLFI